MSWRGIGRAVIVFGFTGLGIWIGNILNRELDWRLGVWIACPLSTGLGSLLAALLYDKE